MAHEGARDTEFFMYLLIYSNKLAYLQLIKVLVYRSSPTESHEQGYLKFLLSKKSVYCSFRCGITLSECKTKAIQTNLGTSRHNKTYSGIIQAYSAIFRTMCYPDILKTMVYPEP